MKSVYILETLPHGSTDIDFSLPSEVAPCSVANESDPINDPLILNHALATAVLLVNLNIPFFIKLVSKTLRASVRMRCGSRNDFRTSRH